LYRPTTQNAVRRDGADYFGPPLAVPAPANSPFK